MSLPSTSLVLTQNKKYNLVIHQHHFLLHNSFPEEFPIYSCFPLRSNNSMAEDPHTKFHAGRIERGRIVLLRTCDAHSIYLYFMGVAAEKSSQFMNQAWFHGAVFQVNHHTELITFSNLKSLNMQKNVLFLLFILSGTSSAHYHPLPLKILSIMPTMNMPQAYLLRNIKHYLIQGIENTSNNNTTSKKNAETIICCQQGQQLMFILAWEKKGQFSLYHLIS